MENLVPQTSRNCKYALKSLTLIMLFVAAMVISVILLSPDCIQIGKMISLKSLGKYQLILSKSIATQPKIEKNTTRPSTSKATINQPKKLIEKNVTFAIVFSALARSMKYTINSVQKNLFAVLDKRNMTYHTYIHTYTLNHSYYNVRDGLENFTLDPDQYKLLHADFEMLPIDQDVIAAHLNLTEYRKRGNGWGYGRSWQLTDHFIIALYSRYLVTLELQKNVRLYNYSYQYVMFMRPDMMLPVPVHINSFINTLSNATQNGEKVVLTSSVVKAGKSFHRLPKTDDKFSMCKTDVCIQYGLGWQHLLQYSQKWPLHSETWKSYLIIKLLKAKLVDIDLHYLIIRANGHAEMWGRCVQQVESQELRDSIEPCNLVKPPDPKHETSKSRSLKIFRKL